MKHLLTTGLLIIMIVAIGKSNTAPDSLPPSSQTSNKIKYTVLGIKELHSKNDTVRLGEIIAVKLKEGDPVDSVTSLFVDGFEIKKSTPWKVNKEASTVFFHVSGGVQDLVESYLVKEATYDNVVKINVSVGDSTTFSKATVPLYFKVKHKIKGAWIWIVALIIPMAFCIYYGLSHNILKDDKNFYYSLGRTQLFFWTVLFGICYLFIWFSTSSLPDITDSVLVLLGISATTTAAAKVIENTNEQLPAAPAAPPPPASQGWFVDILSDGRSVSVHRFQNVVFTVVFGVIFIQKAASTLALPEFDTNALLLMGISSGTYAGLKITEAK